MSGTGFVLDPRLTEDTCPVTSLPLCDVLLMNDARYPWLILVPRQADLVEIADLGDGDQIALWSEVNRAAAALRLVAPCEKLNIGALGIIVRQLHIHVVARNQGDAAWPGPVWGYGDAEPYSPMAREALIDGLRKAFAP
ncbi:HIT domain-containing protein [Rhodanobacter glycinis]|uniref:HIT domain-containing protein n=1 Tax=Rhodanobacter glycinis TaxID=582702 RepID=UPI00112A6710|nr:HIT family protein [Rhodanobacter glycinis]TPG51022.1 HIT domain-containing protein [Rhodanobacter glycinis]